MEFGILGPLEVRADGRAVALGGAKPRALLAVLALHANQPVSAERLAAAMWGEDVPPSAVKTVQVYVSRLRKLFDDPEVLTTTPAGYRLRVRPGELDAERFERQVATGREALAAGRAQDAAAEVRAALELWRGPPLAELASMPFAPPEIARLEEQQLAALELRVEADLASGRHAELVGELRQLTRRHPWRERLHALLMLALYRSGRQADALEAYRQAREVLVEQLGIEPGPELHEAQQAILAHDPGLDLPSSAAGPRATTPRVLPSSPTTLIGRESDVDRIASSLRDPELRLLTLVGPGGVGKTRLALAAATRLRDAFADGVVFVSLAPLAEAAELAAAIAVALGVPVDGQEPPVSALQRFLADRALLLVLDNFEHLLDAAPLPSELLAGCPALTVLATSREPLRVAAERLYRVDPLGVPPADFDAAASSVEQYPAVALLLDRARAHDPDFRLDSRNAPHVGYLCRRLDGLPLALELAAARLGLLEVAELTARLDRALDVLTTGARDAPARQRTLRDTIDWSYGLLSEAERLAFARMALFPGGARPAVAEGVTGASIDTLDSLVAKQLVVRRSGRLVQLETIREYALEKLDADPDLELLHERLVAWCLALVRDATPHLRGRDRAAYLTLLDEEMPNLRAALSWSIGAHRGDDALGLVGALGRYWFDSFRHEEGLRWTDEALAQAGIGSGTARARALLEGALLVGPRKAERFRAQLEDAHRLFEAAGDDAGAAECLSHLAVERAWHDDAGGIALAADAVQLAQRSGDEFALAIALVSLVHASPDYRTAARHAPAAIEHLRSLGNLLETALVCSEVGYNAVAEERYEEGLHWLDQGLTASDELGSPKTRFLIRGNQGVALFLLGRVEQAAQAFADACAICVEAGSERLVDETLLGSAAVAAEQGDVTRAALLAAAAESHQVVRRAPDEQRIWDRLQDRLEQARKNAEVEEWSRAAREGARLGVREALEVATSGVLRAPPELSARGSRGRSGRTRRPGRA